MLVLFFVLKFTPWHNTECRHWFILRFCIMLLRKYSTDPESSLIIGCLRNTVHLFLHPWYCYACDIKLVRNVVVHVWCCTVSHAQPLLQDHACDKPVMFFKTASSCDVIFYMAECNFTHSSRALVLARNPVNAGHKFPVCWVGGATCKHYFSLIVRILVESYDFYGVLFMVAGCLEKSWRLAMCASLIMCWHKQLTEGYNIEVCWHKQLTEGYNIEVCWPKEWHNWLSKDGKTSLTSVVFSSKCTTLMLQFSCDLWQDGTQSS